MKYILDTDTLIYFLNGRHKAIAHKIETLSIEELATTIITRTELLYGALNSDKKERNVKTIRELLNDLHIFQFTEKASDIFAEEKTKLKKQGALLDDMDMMIASIALANNSILITNNVKHFGRIKKLKVENWVSL